MPARCGCSRRRGRIATAPRAFPRDVAGDSLIEDLQLPTSPSVKAVGDQLEVEAAVRAPIDRGWVAAFLVTLLRHSLRPHGRRLVALRSASVRSPRCSATWSSPCCSRWARRCRSTSSLQRFSHPLERRAWRWWVAAEPQRLRGRAVVRAGVRTGAAVPAAIRDAVAGGPALDTRRARPGRAPRTAVRGDHRGHGADLGHELVLRHRELGRRHLQLVGRDPHRRLARGDGSRRPRRASTAAGESATSPCRRPASPATALLVHRHRRHR